MNTALAGQALVFYDGACPVCSAEMDMLRRHDREHRLAMIDIAAPAFDEQAWPVSRANMSTLLHVRLADGAWRKGMAAIREIYRLTGRGWMLAPTGWPLISRVCDRAYAWFARHRMQISARLGMRRCADGVCGLPRQGN